MDKKEKKEIGTSLAHFGSAASGLVLGSLGMKALSNVLSKVNGIPDIALQIIPGLAGMTLAFVVGMKSKHKLLDSAALGLGIAGFADTTKKVVGKFVPQVGAAIPTLSGPVYRPLNGLGANYGAKAVNQGDFPPSYYKENAFQGLGNGSGYDLMGPTGSGYALQGPYDLEGFGRALMGN